MTPGVAEWHYDVAGFWSEPQGFRKSFHSQIQQRQQIITPEEIAIVQAGIEKHAKTNLFILEVFHGNHLSHTPSAIERPVEYVLANVRNLICIKIATMYFISLQ